jgi:hypothetical protein
MQTKVVTNFSLEKIISEFLKFLLFFHTFFYFAQVMEKKKIFVGYVKTASIARLCRVI